jgi:hypothetical protein
MPDIGGFNPVRHLSKVDFPIPFSPWITIACPLSQANSRFERRGMS